MVAALCLVLAAAPGVTRAAALLPTGFVDEPVVSNLDAPVGMSFAPDGRLFVCEQKTGRIHMIVNGHLAATDPAGTVDSLENDNVERGLQCIAVDPRWPAAPYVYVQYTHIGSREVIARYTATGDLGNPSGENITLSQRRLLIYNIRDIAQNHNGGGVRFGPDGMLYVSQGDDTDACSSQSPTSLLGKLMRLDISRIPAGGGGPVPKALLIPPNNPLSGPDSNAMLVYAMGFRNPWRFHIDPATGRILLADVGENAVEEFDDVVPGGNYGWPFREGTLVRTVGGCTEPGGPGGTTYNAPLLTLTHSAGFTAVFTASVYRPVAGGTSNWPSNYNGSLFIGDYYDSQLRQLTFDGSRWNLAPPVPGQPDPNDWASEIHYACDFGVGPDGSLWWLKQYDDGMTTHTGSIRRIRYVPALGVTAQPRTDRPLTASPNPFRGAVTFGVMLEPGETGRIEIYDPAGRSVRTLTSHGNAAARSIEWDGRDSGGEPVRAGLYFAKLQRRSGVAPLRVVKMP
jgi:glucose/arabinose dehydrogenase